MGPTFSLKFTFCPAALKINKISENIIAASRLYLSIGCRETFVASLIFKQKLIKFLFFFLII